MNDTPPPNSTHDLLCALADGELDLRASTDALAQIAEDPKGAQRIAFQQQLRRSVATSMGDPALRCPDALRSQIEALATSTPRATAPAAPGSTTPPNDRPSAAHAGPPVLARIGRWAPAAIAAVLLIAATAVFVTNRPQAQPGPTAPVLDVNTVQKFGNRHIHCAQDPLHNLHHPERFGQSLDQLPHHLEDYFTASTDGLSLDLSAIQYDYQLAGACSLPGSGAVHLVYRHHDNPDRAMSLWIAPAQPEVTQHMTPGRIYIETGQDIDHPVILWEDQGLLFYLVADSLQDAQHAMQTLRQHPA